ncbi:P27 family phage terminase small subunit [Blastochloris tepida]|uniref:Uncharacterized protein n=1 Tax=Blastochloris tepida TaxID=2233851 RepID=A0A348G1D4_9HYPH|nr:P27 family phage terminase small subunit [Blastochloris tepida]BBF93367.1 hypothetical protein BLTE_20520 [Blastochloris tepida]
MTPLVQTDPLGFLATDRAIFQRVFDDLLRRRVVRRADLKAYALWVYYLRRWVEAKDQLEGCSSTHEIETKHGKILLVNPLYAKTAKVCEENCRYMIALEDRLGINPASRQTVIRNLAELPHR